MWTLWLHSSPNVLTDRSTSRSPSGAPHENRQARESYTAAKSTYGGMHCTFWNHQMKTDSPNEQLSRSRTIEQAQTKNTLSLEHLNLIFAPVIKNHTESKIKVEPKPSRPPFELYIISCGDCEGFSLSFRTALEATEGLTALIEHLTTWRHKNRLIEEKRIRVSLPINQPINMYI